MTIPPLGMTDDDFRKYGQQVIDWVASYHEHVAELPVQSAVNPGDIRAMLPDAAPESPEPFEAIIADLDRVVMPGITHWQSPEWFAYFPGNTSYPVDPRRHGFAAGLAQQGMMWSTRAGRHRNRVAHDGLVGGPARCAPGNGRRTSTGGGVVQMSASDSTHTALVVARNVCRSRTAFAR